ncbi:hypothetical protein [Rhizobium sp. UGM030330-04]|uniref:hypothetical protein n=1 Tax=Rhizobium sp. UGM030330-04 TaxID=1378077 RepID=UPI001AEC8F64|nr:hypothetical protein [Rhizobium sp. UGM030330-04]
MKALESVKQSILTTIKAKGIEVAEKRYIEALPALSSEQRQMRRLFAQLEQNQNGKWGFRPE